MKISPVKQIKDGLVTNNPIFVQFLGMCSALAITTSVTNAVGMGVAVTAVLICSNVLISLLRRFIVPQIRIAAFIVIISGFVTAVELLIKAYFPALDKSLGLFIPLIVVNCMILARAESFASKNGVVASAIDGFSMGLGYTAAVVVTAAVRELLGTGKLLAAADGSGGFTVLGDWYSPANIFILPPGAFLTLAFLCALFQKLRTVSDEKKVRDTAENADNADALEEDDESFEGGELLYAAELAADMTADDSAEQSSAEAADADDAILADDESWTAEPDFVENITYENTSDVPPADSEVTEEYADETIPDDFAQDEAPAEPEIILPPAGTPVFDFGAVDEPAEVADEAPEFDFAAMFREENAIGDTDGDSAEAQSADEDSILTDDPILAALMNSDFDDDAETGKGEKR